MDRYEELVLVDGIAPSTPADRSDVKKVSVQYLLVFDLSNNLRLAIMHKISHSNQSMNQSINLNILCCVILLVASPTPAVENPM